MSKDSFVEQLASFDLSTPVEVKVIFEDEEDEVASADINIKQENTTEEESNTNDNSNKINTSSDSHEETYIELEIDLSPVTKKIKQSEGINTNSGNKDIKEHLPNKNNNNNQVKRKKKKNLDQKISKKLETSTQLNTKPIHHHTATILANDMVKNPEFYDNNKRKLEDNFSHDLKKISSVSSENKSTPKHYQFPVEELASLHQKTTRTQDNAPNVTEDTKYLENSSNTEMTCITKLLNSVSNHLILAIDAYCKYVVFREKKPKNCPETLRAWNNFLRIKYHFFNLSFCTVDSIILPQEKNVFFTGKFLNDTIKLAASKKLTLCLETQVAPLFLELLEWTKQKKLRLNSIPIETDTNVVPNAKPTQNQPLLNQQLKSPLKNFTNTGTIVQTGWNACVNASQQNKPLKETENSNVINEITRFANNYHPEMAAILNSATNKGLTSIEDMNRHHQLDHLRTPYGGQNIQHQNVENNLNKFSNSRVEYNVTSMAAPQTNQNLNFNAGCLPKSNQIQMQSKRCIQDPNISPNKAKYMPLNRTENPKSVLFAKGPPGRQVSISVLRDILATNNSTTNTASNPHQMNAAMVNTYSQNKMPSAPPSYEDTLRTSQNNQMYSRQQSHTGQQNFLNNSNVQIQSNRGNQNAIAAIEQMSQNYNQGNQIYIQQGQLSSQQSMGSNSNLQNNVSQGYQTNGTTAPWQQGTSGYIRPDPKQIVPPQPLIQPEHQHQEIARSGSTDSGFMSPLNFYSPETIKDGTEDDSLLLSPMITHVTSLHPEVTYIKEGSCYVCGNMTRKMCNGCYRKYYCSLECQRFDWNIHKTTCGSAT